MKTEFEAKAMAAKQECGFSFIELMLVVAIIGIIATLAVPKFATFQAKARQAEAQTNLSHIYTLEEAHFTAADTYAMLAPTPAAGVCAANTLGYQPKPCSGARYSYSIPAGGATFIATAAAIGKIVSGCATVDTWTITEAKILVATTDAMALCI